MVMVIAINIDFKWLLSSRKDWDENANGRTSFIHTYVCKSNSVAQHRWTISIPFPFCIIFDSSSHFFLSYFVFFLFSIAFFGQIGSGKWKVKLVCTRRKFESAKEGRNRRQKKRQP